MSDLLRRCVWTMVVAPIKLPVMVLCASIRIPKFMLKVCLQHLMLKILKEDGKNNESNQDDEISKLMTSELMKLVLEKESCDASFENFPYYLTPRNREMLKSIAYVQLKQFSKHTRELNYLSGPGVMLYAPSEKFAQALAKALARDPQIEAKLLLLDLTSFSATISKNYGKALLKTKVVDESNDFENTNMESELESEYADPEDEDYSANTIRALSFDEDIFIKSLQEVLTILSSTSPVILYIRNANELILSRRTMFVNLQEMFTNLNGPVLTLGSNMESMVRAGIYPFISSLVIAAPKDEEDLKKWKDEQEKNRINMEIEDQKSNIIEILTNNDIVCEDLDSIVTTNTINPQVEEIVFSAVSYHLMNTEKIEYKDEKLVISSKSLAYGIEKVKEEYVQSEDEQPKNPVDNCCKNSWEEKLKSDIVPPNEIEVTFDDIGALEDIKRTLHELVILPLRRPNLFNNGGLLKPCKGVLLFGPPGTGKTMLAKAIAKESGANFINVSVSSIISKWLGDSEKTVKALFSLAARVAPTIIFVDEVDSFLGRRTSTEHEANRKVKNEFMSLWDGLRTNSSKQILVLGATNRPFDLDEAIIRRFERRIMVSLPCKDSRESILRKILAKDNVGNMDFKELASTTEGYTGSDLKILCTTAAYQPVRELLEKERSTSEKNHPNESKNEELSLRPVNMDDMKHAKKQVAASCSLDAFTMKELKEWNAMYGEGGSRKLESLTYYF